MNNTNSAQMTQRDKIIGKLHAERATIQTRQRWLKEGGCGPDKFQQEMIQMYDTAISHAETGDYRAAIDDLSRFPRRGIIACIYEEITALPDVQGSYTSNRRFVAKEFRYELTELAWEREDQGAEVEQAREPARNASAETLVCSPQD